MNKLKSYLNLRLAIGIVVGAIGGYAYYYYVGCNSGSCAITSSPVNSTLYGVLFGGLLFYKKNDSEDSKDQDQQKSSDS